MLHNLSSNIFYILISTPEDTLLPPVWESVYDTPRVFVPLRESFYQSGNRYIPLRESFYHSENLYTSLRIGIYHSESLCTTPRIFVPVWGSVYAAEQQSTYLQPLLDLGVTPEQQECRSHPYKEPANQTKSPPNLTVCIRNVYESAVQHSPQVCAVLHTEIHWKSGEMVNEDFQRKREGMFFRH